MSWQLYPFDPVIILMNPPHCVVLYGTVLVCMSCNTGFQVSSILTD